jgi:hypothetical protein
MSGRFDTSQTSVIKPGMSFATVSSAVTSMSQTQTLAPLATNARAISFLDAGRPGRHQYALCHGYRSYLLLFVSVRVDERAVRVEQVVGARKS